MASLRRLLALLMDSFFTILFFSFAKLIQHTVIQSPCCQAKCLLKNFLSHLLTVHNLTFYFSFTTFNQTFVLNICSKHLLIIFVYSLCSHSKLLCIGTLILFYPIFLLHRQLSQRSAQIKKLILPKVIKAAKKNLGTLISRTLWLFYGA